MTNEEALKLAREVTAHLIVVERAGRQWGVYYGFAMMKTASTREEAVSYADSLAQPVADLILKVRAEGYDEGSDKNFPQLQAADCLLCLACGEYGCADAIRHTLTDESSESSFKMLAALKDWMFMRYLNLEGGGE